MAFDILAVGNELLIRKPLEEPVETHCPADDESHCFRFEFARVA
ncbi:MAG: hypothetical protein ABIW19_06220 [Vicinamibacterales bacterium]